MAEEGVFGLDSEEDFVRMANAVRKVEGLPPRRDSQAIYRAAPEGNAHNWIKATSSTASTITLGGGTVTGYAAVWGFFDSGGTGWTWTTNVVWLVVAPGGLPPIVGNAYECRLLGADTSGVPIWGVALPGPNSVTATGLASAYTATSTFTNVGASVHLNPGASYMLFGCASGTLTAGGNVTDLQVRFDPAVVSNSPVGTVCRGESGRQVAGTATIFGSILTVTVGTNVDIQARYVLNGDPAPTEATITAGAGLGTTVLLAHSF